ncbi:MAG: OmpA family protein [Proteobacteria bacterium]|nr:OmpA family protein [Pseudomonadota bacterium]
MITRVLAFGCALIGLALSQAPASAQAPVKSDQIIERLKEPPAPPAAAAPPVAGAAPVLRGARRGISPSGPAGAYAPPPSAASPSPSSVDKAAADAILSKPAGSLSNTERNRIADYARARPSLDLTIYFDFNSSEISPKAVPALVELGKALSSDALKDARILVAGHTDGKGGDVYNLHLSQRRADAIKTFLVQQFGIPHGRVLAIGYGKEQLLNRANPFADENRRVQLVNFSG